MRQHRAGTKAACEAARKTTETKARKRLLALVEEEKLAREAWERMVEANLHLLTTDGEPVEH